MKVERVDKVIAKLRGRLRDVLPNQPKVSVSVGYQTNYALYVHENKEMKLQGQPRKPPAKGDYWDPNGQPKYLEQPARQYAKQIAMLVYMALKSGKPLWLALMSGGLFLQRISQVLVPVDTGTLKNSAFTRVDQPGTVQ